MNINAIGIPLTFIILASLGLWMILYSKGTWYFKLLYIFLCLYFSFFMWYSLSDLSGWATDSKFPQKSMIHWILVQEPSKTNMKESGNIFIWATELDEENQIVDNKTLEFLKPFSARKNLHEPRSYRLPYTEELHKKAAQAMQLLMQGKSLIGEASGDSIEDGQGESSSGTDGEKQKGGGSLSQQQIFKFYELPPAKLPSKITGREE